MAIRQAQPAQLWCNHRDMHVRLCAISLGVSVGVVLRRHPASPNYAAAQGRPCGSTRLEEGPCYDVKRNYSGRVEVRCHCSKIFAKLSFLVLESQNAMKGVQKAVLVCLMRC